MKIIIRTLLATALLYMNTSLNAMQITDLTVITINSDNITREAGHGIRDQQLYTNGGLTFTYPTGLFTQTPTISLTIEAAPHADTFTFVAEVSVNSSASTTIMVYKVTNVGTVSEAATNDVTVHIEAAGL